MNTERGRFFSLSMLTGSLFLILFLADFSDAVSFFGVSARHILYFIFFVVFSYLFFAGALVGLTRSSTVDISASGIIFLCFLFCIFFVTAREVLEGGFESYSAMLYVAERILAILFFVIIFIIFFLFGVRLSEEEGRFALIFPILVGLSFSLIAIFDYVLVGFGFEYSFRNSGGTDYGEINERFYYYSFHRALGVNREPSLLAANLLPVLFLAISQERYYAAFFISAAVFLTLSIIGFVALAATICIVLLLRFRVMTNKNFLFGCLSIFIGFSIGNLVTFTYNGEDIDYLSYRWALIVGEIDTRSGAANGVGADNGVDASTTAVVSQFSGGCVNDFLIKSGLDWACLIPGRGDIVRYLFDDLGTAWGLGIGFANMELGRFFGIPMPASFLSSVVAIFAIGGIVGLAILFLWFVVFVSSLVIRFRRVDRGHLSPFSGFLMVIICSLLLLTLLLEQPSAIISSLLGFSLGALRGYDGFMGLSRAMRRG